MQQRNRRKMKDQNGDKMNMLANAMNNDSNKTYTENGQMAYASTLNKCLDLFATIGALRNADPTRIQRLFADAYAENPLVATKTLFYARDIREGLGEKETFRKLLKYAATYHPECIQPNIYLISEYGRYDDLYSLIDTPLEHVMWYSIMQQFEADRAAMARNENISLLAKWIKTADASSPRTRALGILTAQKLHYSVYEFKRIIRAMRKYLNVVEAKMTRNEWSSIEYSSVPSLAMLRYRNAFKRHDEDRFNEFINDAITGKAKINANALFPYDIVEKYLYGDHDNDSLEAQWRQLPNYVDNTNILVVADVSGSMYGRPMATSIGLGMYFAEHNHGAFRNMFMTFSDEPTIVTLKGETLAQKIKFMENADWDYTTNLKSVFDKVLELAVSNNVPAEDLPKSIVIISDMEINKCCNEKDFYDTVKSEYAAYHYELPNLVFWNVNSRNDTFLATSGTKGIQLISGQSVTVFKQLINSIGMKPEEMMMETINSDRYSPITIAVAN